MQEALNEAIQQALTKIQNRSYADRNPALGKMINCAVCTCRHREFIHCKLRYVIQNDSVTPRPRTRFNPHPKKRSLQLVERTKMLYPQNEPYISDPVECMHESRKQAQRQLKKERNAKRKIKQHQQKVSRLINRGLRHGGSR